LVGEDNGQESDGDDGDPTREEPREVGAIVVCQQSVCGKSQQRPGEDQRRQAALNRSVAVGAARVLRLQHHPQSGCERSDHEERDEDGLRPLQEAETVNLRRLVEARLEPVREHEADDTGRDAASRSA
jgi:hypothetical protein